MTGAHKHSPPSPPQGKLRRLWPVIPLVGILIALMLADFNDFMGYSPFNQDPCSLTEIDQSGFSANLYNHIASWMLPTPAPSSDPAKPYPMVSIVTIDAKTEPPGLLTNACDSRKFVARLVDDLTSLGAALIMIDKYYSTDYCADQGDQFVSRIAARTVASNVPVVVGRPTHALPANLQASGCLALSPKLPFPETSKVYLGLTRLNADSLKIPLHWPVFNDPTAPLPTPIQPAISMGSAPAAAPTPANDPDGNGLALVAAENFHPDIPNYPKVDIADNPKVKEMLKEGIHPYTTFLDLPTTNAMTVLCNAEPAHKYSIDPNAPASTPSAPPAVLTGPDLCQPWIFQTPDQLTQLQSTFAKKIAVIGDLSDQDMQPFPGGNKPGVFLQANYVQAILDQRFLVEIPLAVTLSGLLFYVICVYCLYWSHDVHGEPHLSAERAGIASLLLLIVLVAISIVALRFFFYTPVWALWGAGVFMVFRYLEASGHHRSQHLLGQLAGHPSHGHAGHAAHTSHSEHSAAHPVKEEPPPGNDNPEE